MPGERGGIRCVCLRLAGTTDYRGCPSRDRLGLIRPRTRPPSTLRFMPEGRKFVVEFALLVGDDYVRARQAIA